MSQRFVQSIVVGIIAAALAMVGFATSSHAADLPTPDHTPAEANVEARRLADQNAGQSNGTQPGDQTSPGSPSDTSTGNGSSPPRTSTPRSTTQLSLPSGLLWVVLGLAILALLWMIFKAFTGRTKHHKVDEPAAGSDAKESELRDDLTPAERLRPGDSWRRRALDHEANGQWRLAIRARFRGLLVDLSDQGVVREARGKTAGEYRLDVAAREPGVSATFDSASELFEGAWYGPVEPSKADCAQIAQQSDQVLAAPR